MNNLLLQDFALVIPTILLLLYSQRTLSDLSAFKVYFVADSHRALEIESAVKQYLSAYLTTGLAIYCITVRLTNFEVFLFAAYFSAAVVTPAILTIFFKCWVATFL